MADTPAGSAPATPAAPAPPASATATPSVSGSSPAPSGSQPASPLESGEPPRERWNDILENARKKTRAEVAQEYESKYGRYQQFEQDPWTAVQGWLNEASQHSIYGPMVKQYFREQMQAQQPASLGEEPKADVPVVDSQGNITGYTYSDKALRQWQQWNEQRLKSELDERFGTLEQKHAQWEQREQLIQLHHEANQHAQTVLTELRSQPYFKEHEPAIKQALMDHPEWGDNVHAAYTHVLVSQILPTLSQAEQRQAVQSLTGKAAGSSVAPGGTAPAAPKFKSFKDAARYYQEHPDEAAAMAKR